jgi:hypothetical protein
MKRAFLLPFILYFFVMGAVLGSEAREELETLRAGNVFEPIDLSSFPKMTTVRECYQLCLSLIQSEIKFWTDSQKCMLEDNKRLSIIVSLLTPKEIPLPAAPGVRAPLPKFERAIVGLEVREKIFINPKDPSDTTNKDLYDIYKSYSAIIKDLTSILKNYMTYNDALLSLNPKNEHHFIENLKTNLLGQIKEIEATNFLYRGILQGNSVGMKLSQICRDQKGKFQGEIGNGFSKYAFCDVEYVSDIFIPTICEILQNTQTQITQIEMERKSKITQAKRAKKQRNKINRREPKRTPLTQATNSTDSSVSSVLIPTTPSLSGQDAPKSDHGTYDVAMPIPLSGQVQDDTMVDFQGDEVLEIETTDTAGVEATDLAISQAVAPKLLGAEAPALNDNDTSANVLYEPDIPYDPRPWERYKFKKAILQGNPEPLKLLSAKTPMPFMLETEYSFTARTLLGMSMSSQEKVEMCDYENLVIKGLKGAVLGRKKTIYFMAQSLVTQQWCSVAMHRLHQDDSHIIPRDTRYWKIARQLLLDIELAEKNLQPLL